MKNCKVEKVEKKPTFVAISGPHLKRTYEIDAESEKNAEAWCAAIAKQIEHKQASVTKEDADTSESNVVDIQGKKQQEVCLDDFDLLCVLGRGSFGKVMKVRKKDTKEIFAMKILSKEMLIKQNMISYTKTEKNILQSVDHPFIVSLKFAFQTEAKLYLVLTYLSGGELFFHLSNEVKFTIDRTRFYAAELVLAIGHLHSMDIIYRDLKPENVVLDSQGHVQVTDFGLAKKEINSENPTSTFCGTPEYLAPEIIRGKGHSKPVDWWSLGILIYEMLVGLPPFYSENMNEMYELILKAPLKFPSFVPSDAQSLLKSLLERDESKRLGSGKDDYKEIQSHAFFASIDWEKLYARKITPPFIPEVGDEEDNAKYFDSEFTSERVVDSFAVSVKEDKNASFDGFDFHGK
jgi:serum/glucocorticoid-regulated kinase 2